ncbi:GlxA family transcriptional regulator [Ensifer adhaerens]|uniref:GlxA family transcriptional regulator n=1 Tax=Ensifer adhaerens TaxID=106592 RepID=UPI003CFFE1A3
MSENPHQKLKIGFILAKSFTLSAFALFVDTLRLASDKLDHSGRKLADWDVLGSTRQPIRSSCGVQVVPTSNLIDPATFSYIVVVGGLLDVEEPIDREAKLYLQRASDKKVPLIGVCTGSFILAAAGLMKQHYTCVNWLHFREFRELFPDHKVRADRLYNLDRYRGSCAGGSSAADMAAAIVRRFISRDAERNALEVLLLERARSPLEVQPRRPLFSRCDDPRLQSALILMEGHLDSSLSIPKLADTLGVSRRQLERLFMAKMKLSPAQAYKQVRMEHAKTMLLQSKAPLVEIALEVGFANASHFSRQFKSVVGKSPSRFRAAE